MPGLVVDDLAAVADDGTLVPLVGRHVRIQTPQIFAAAPLLDAYHRAAEVGFEGTDTAACLERFSTLKVTYVPGRSRTSRSLTHTTSPSRTSWSGAATPTADLTGGVWGALAAPQGGPR